MDLNYDLSYWLNNQTFTRVTNPVWKCIQRGCKIDIFFLATRRNKDKL